MTLAISGTTGITLATQFDSASTFAFKNRFINGQMQVAQRATSATVTAGTTVPTISTGYPCVDRFFVYCVGANVTAAQVAGSGANRNNLQVTGAASVTAVGIGQRIEVLNSYDLAGSTCTLSVNISNSLLTTVTWTASYATTADTFGTIGTPTKTQIATGTFTVTGTLANYSAQISVPAAATTGIEILFTVGAQTSGTWVIGNAQFEPSTTVATSFDYRPYGTELALCQRYYYRVQSTANSQIITSSYNDTTTVARGVFTFPVTMRSVPTALEQSSTAANYAVSTTAGFTNCSSVPTFASASQYVASINFTVASGLTAGQGSQLFSGSASGASAYLGWSAEL